MMANRHIIFGIILLAATSAGMWSVVAEEPVSSAEGEISTFVYDDHGKRDPLWRLVNAQGVIVSFEKDANAASSSDNMALEGIVYEDGGSVAMINGTMVQVGETIGAYVVETIAPHEVVLKKGEESLSLMLSSEVPDE